MEGWLWKYDDNSWQKYWVKLSDDNRSLVVRNSIGLPNTENYVLNETTDVEIISECLQIRIKYLLDQFLLFAFDSRVQLLSWALALNNVKFHFSNNQQNINSYQQECDAAQNIVADFVRAWITDVRLEFISALHDGMTVTISGKASGGWDSKEQVISQLQSLRLNQSCLEVLPTESDSYNMHTFGIKSKKEFSFFVEVKESEELYRLSVVLNEDLVRMTSIDFSPVDEDDILSRLRTQDADTSEDIVECLAGFHDNVPLGHTLYTKKSSKHFWHNNKAKEYHYSMERLSHWVTSSDCLDRRAVSGTAVLHPEYISIPAPIAEYMNTSKDVSNQVACQAKSSQEVVSPPPPSESSSNTVQSAAAAVRNAVSVRRLPPPPMMKGYLMKKGEKRRNWNKRYFVLTSSHHAGTKLAYYKSHCDCVPYGVDKKGELMLNNYVLHKSPDYLKLISSSDDRVMKMIGCDDGGVTQEQCEQAWISAINDHLEFASSNVLSTPDEVAEISDAIRQGYLTGASHDIDQISAVSQDFNLLRGPESYRIGEALMLNLRLPCVGNTVASVGISTFFPVSATVEKLLEFAKQKFRAFGMPLKEELWHKYVVKICGHRDYLLHRQFPLYMYDSLSRACRLKETLEISVATLSDSDYDILKCTMNQSLRDFCSISNHSLLNYCPLTIFSPPALSEIVYYKHEINAPVHIHVRKIFIAQSVVNKFPPAVSYRVTVDLVYNGSSILGTELFTSPVLIPNDTNEDGFQLIFADAPLNTGLSFAQVPASCRVVLRVHGYSTVEARLRQRKPAIREISPVTQFTAESSHKHMSTKILYTHDENDEGDAIFAVAEVSIPLFNYDNEINCATKDGSDSISLFVTPLSHHKKHKESHSIAAAPVTSESSVGAEESSTTTTISNPAFAALKTVDNNQDPKQEVANESSLQHQITNLEDDPEADSIHTQEQSIMCRPPGENCFSCAQVQLCVNFDWPFSGIRIIHIPDSAESQLNCKTLESPATYARDILTGEDEAQLKTIEDSDLLVELSVNQLILLWECRYLLTQRPRLLSKFLQAVVWSNPGHVVETHQLLKIWSPCTPYEALELLDVKFSDDSVRAFAVNCLNSLDDVLLQELLLQLVQALKYETHHDSPLARFLLGRALLSPLTIGQPLFWLLRSEMHVEVIRERFGLILMVFLSHCGAYKDALAGQVTINSELKVIANALKNESSHKREHFARAQLSQLNERLFVGKTELMNCLTSKFVTKGILVDDCKVMSSKKLPLWVTFENADPHGVPMSVIFKTGDDLRQDQLTLQMIRVMDSIWRGILCKNDSPTASNLDATTATAAGTATDHPLAGSSPKASGKDGREVSFGDTNSLSSTASSNDSSKSSRYSMASILSNVSKHTQLALNRFSATTGTSTGLNDPHSSPSLDKHHRSLDQVLDLRMKGYGCVATGYNTGMIEVVTQSQTLANIQTSCGGKIAGAFSNTTIIEYLKQFNINKDSFDAAVDNFLRTCAGYCVATCVLGIGDRHGDNIMVTKNGHLFHIDFGHFLGDFKSKFGINRERSLFVFTPEMAHVVQGTSGVQFSEFESICCRAYNELRKRARFLITLFALMIPAGLPNLMQVGDIQYLKNMLALELSDQEADAKFVKEIKNALNTVSRRIDNWIHNLKHNA